MFICLDKKIVLSIKSLISLRLTLFPLFSLTDLSEIPVNWCLYFPSCCVVFVFYVDPYVMMIKRMTLN